MNRYQIIKQVKKLIGRLSLYLKVFYGLEKSSNPNITKISNLKNNIFQELGEKQSQSEIKEVELPKYLLI